MIIGSVLVRRMLLMVGCCGLLLAAAASAASAASGAAIVGVPSGIYVLDKDHGYISFAYSHLGFSTPHIGFNSFDVTVNLNAEQPQSSTLDVTIDAASIDTRVAEFDGVLKGPDFFDVSRFPTLSFAATRIEMTGDLTATITGDLTIKDITRPVTLYATLNKAATHPLRNVPTMGLNAQARLQRSQWGLSGWLPLVGDEVTVYVTVELVQASEI